MEKSKHVLDGDIVLQRIKDKFQKSVETNFAIRMFTKSNKALEQMVMYIPEIIYILINTERGLAILKETKIYDYIFDETV